MLKSRLVIAFILTLLLTIVTWAPIWCFNIMATLVGILAMKEMANIIEKTGHKPLKWLLYISPIYLLFIRGLVNIIDYQIFILYFIILAFILYSKIVLSDNKFTYIDASMNFLSIIYIIGSFSLLLFTRYLTHEAYYVWLIFVTACLSDSGAYIIGMNFGKHKIPLAISPKKSIEGVFGGLLMSIIGCIIYAYILQYVGIAKAPIYYYAVFGLIGSLVAQLGDFVASAIKRTAGVKDFSNIMPGHGGVVDRFDSVIMVSPLAFIFFSIIL